MSALRVVSPMQRPALEAAEARKLTDRIRARVAELLPLIKEAFERRADVALGYDNWLAYCDAELRGLRLPVQQRREAVTELRQSGMPTRAIGPALGVDHSTVVRDLAANGEDAPVPQPERVVSLDGRERPATRPAPAPEPERPKPPAWDPAERAAHEAEVRRVQIIESARTEAKRIVTTVRAAVVTVVSGARLGERGLVTRDMVAELRAAIDLLEKEIDGE